MLHLAGLSYKITAAIRDNLNIWTTLQNWLLPLNGLAHLISLFSNSYFQDSAKLLILGSIVEAGRRLFQWFLERFRIQYSITAEFPQGDPAYEWLSHFLNHEEVWRRACDFRVSSKNSSRKWGISAGKISELVEYVPTYLRPQLFRWRGYWVEISRVQEDSGGPFGHSSPGLHYPTVSTMYLTIYTLDMSAMSAIIEEAHQRYLEVSKADVIVHGASDHHHVGSWDWVKRQRRRPFSSIILQEGVLETILQDAKEFFATEAWYIERGIPHRRGYLLHGPPGSGKSSTICALAGELGLEIYTLSLASNHIDDLYLQRAADSIPKNSIFVIEDIDCAMPSWDIDEDASQMAHSQIMMNWRSPSNRTRVTLSTLLNVIDGLGSEEGRLFFTTTNHIDRLEPALIRPGRIDRKIPYYLATQEQAATLFMHFFPPASAPSINPHSKALENGILDRVTHENQIIQLSKTFASHIPSNEFSIADLQGYLLGYKDQPERAAVEFSAWAEQEREFKCQAEEKAARKKMKKEITQVKSSKP
ncbi:P-loop containing nucleoside triphosphate hydrolase protein [Lentinula raphanica]|nr:P-loop containing nucleoside triphosphate hydrolase protein [Lentinula raphanica]